MALQISNPTSEAPSIDLRGLTPALLRERPLDAIQRIEVGCGNQRIELGQLCRIEGEAESMQWRLQGDFHRWESVGAELDAGSIVVEGDVGHRAAARMTGGELTIQGDAGDWLGAEMAGGALHLHGNAGDAVGGAFRGSRRGMTGGEIFIHGNAGDEVGARMRRGLIAVAGAVGDWAAMRMLAGSLIIMGACGRRPGAGMQRGTIGLFGGDAPALLPTFVHGCRMRLPMLALIQGRLARAEFKTNVDRLVDLFHGDLVESGRGEILVAAE